MDIIRMLRTKGEGARSRDDVARAVDRKLADTPERRHTEVLEGLRSSASRAHGDASRKDGDNPGGGAGGGAGGGEQGGAPQQAPEAPANLPIEATLTTAQTVRGGLNPGGGAFGLMDPTFSFQNVAHQVQDGKIQLTAVMHCDYHWGVHSLGNIDVPNGTAPFITAENYEEIANDIDPDIGPDANAAAYSKYWSRAATEAHELEHARDDWADWAAQNTGVTIARNGFAAETAPSNAVDAAISRLLTQGGSGRHPGKVAELVMDGSDLHYGAAMDYMARPGEQKAHAVGARIERPLAAAVRQHGKQLADAAKAKKEEQAVAGGAGGGAGGGGGQNRRLKADVDRTVSSLMGMFD